jgi:hypothetical protein
VQVHAVRASVLPKGTVKFDVTLPETYTGETPRVLRVHFKITETSEHLTLSLRLLGIVRKESKRGVAPSERFSKEKS